MKIKSPAHKYQRRCQDIPEVFEHSAQYIEGLFDLGFSMHKSRSLAQRIAGKDEGWEVTTLHRSVEILLLALFCRVDRFQLFATGDSPRAVGTGMFALCGAANRTASRSVSKCVQRLVGQGSGA